MNMEQDIRAKIVCAGFGAFDGAAMAMICVSLLSPQRKDGIDHRNGTRSPVCGKRAGMPAAFRGFVFLALRASRLMRIL